MASIDLHRLSEERSVAMHQAIAEKSDFESVLLPTARDRIRSWLERGGAHRWYAEEWDKVLSRSSSEVAAFLVERSEHATALRQSSPFAFALDPRTRWAIHRTVGQAKK